MRWVNLLSPEKMNTNSENETLKTPDYHNDYKQICVSRMLRHLENKPVFFPLTSERMVRNQYSYSVEVSAISQVIGSQMIEKIIKTCKNTALNEAKKSQICEALSCAAMLRNVGMPAFGRLGDEVIRYWFRTNLSNIRFMNEQVSELFSREMLKDFYDFSGEYRTLRRVIKYNGEDMNLTLSMLSILIKLYKIKGNKKINEAGYLYSEKGFALMLQEKAELDGQQHPLLYVIEAAEKIVYLTTMLEDSIVMGKMTCAQLLDELRRERYFEKDVMHDEYQRYVALVKRLEDCYCDVKRSYMRNVELITIHKWARIVQDEFIDFSAESFVENYDEVIRGVYIPNLVCDSWCHIMKNVFEEVIHKYTFESHETLELETVLKEKIGYIFDKFIGAVLYYDTDLKSDSDKEKYILYIPEKYKKAYLDESHGRNETEKLYLRFMMVVDYVCDMNDKEINGIFANIKRHGE